MRKMQPKKATILNQNCSKPTHSKEFPPEASDNKLGSAKSQWGKGFALAFSFLQRLAFKPEMRRLFNRKPRQTESKMRIFVHVPLCKDMHITDSTYLARMELTEIVYEAHPNHSPPAPILSYD